VLFPWNNVSVLLNAQMREIMSVSQDQGVEVVAAGKRRWVDTHWFRGNSYFRIGWQWVKTALECGWRLIHQVRFIGNHDPDPAIASRKQHEKRCYRLEFNIQTYQYGIN